MSNILRSVIAFLAFMVIFVGGNAIGGGVGGTLGFVLGIGVLALIATGKAEEFYKKATS